METQSSMIDEFNISITQKAMKVSEIVTDS